MKTIGLTGPSGAGKGFCYQLFEKYNISCIDTDCVYHNLLIPPSGCVDELVLNFGTSIVDENGAIIRKKLAEIVFADNNTEKLNLLNEITHKYVLEVTKSMIANYEANNKLAVVVDAPLLFESKFDSFCDFSIAVISDAKTRLDRIIKRDCITEEAALMRINAQKKDEYYTSRARYTVYNNNDCESLNNQLVEILKKEKLI